jgi:hypothetical protein
MLFLEGGSDYLVGVYTVIEMDVRESGIDRGTSYKGFRRVKS